MSTDERIKGYIYISRTNTDSGAGTYLNDPILDGGVSLGACRPDIRRLVVPGDFIFVVSGRTPSVQQYIVGGFEVDTVIHAKKAHKIYPENRLKKTERGLEGNIICNSSGDQHKLDKHNNFAKRLKNYVVGRNPKALISDREIEIGRSETLNTLQRLFNKAGNRPIDIMGRWARLNPGQIDLLNDWLDGVKRRS